MEKKSSASVYLFLLITFFCWGSVYVVSKFALGAMPAPAVCASRVLVGVLAVLFLARKEERPNFTKEDKKSLLMIAFFGYFSTQMLVTLGISLTGASMAALVNSLKLSTPTRVISHGMRLPHLPQADSTSSPTSSLTAKTAQWRGNAATHAVNRAERDSGVSFRYLKCAHVFPDSFTRSQNSRSRVIDHELFSRYPTTAKEEGWLPNSSRNAKRAVALPLCMIFVILPP